MSGRQEGGVNRAKSLTALLESQYIVLNISAENINIASDLEQWR